MLDKQARTVLDELATRDEALGDPGTPEAKLEKARRMTGGLADFSGKAPADIMSEAARVDGPRGPIPLRIYRPASDAAHRKGMLPCLVWFHGGGAMAGSLDSHDTALSQLTRHTGWAVVSVGYRLGPEDPYPAPHEDCVAALSAMANEGKALGLDAGRLVVGGDSIGGLFATTVARIARDGGGPALKAQIILYPNTDLRPDRDHASLESEEGNVMTRDSLAYENDLYIPDRQDRYSALASPLLAQDLASLPPALLVTCEHDPLRDEGEAYADRLRQSGVAVTSHRYDGMIHGFMQMAGRIDAANDLMARIAAFLDTIAD